MYWSQAQEMHIQWYLAITVATSLIGLSTVNNNFKIDDSFLNCCLQIAINFIPQIIHSPLIPI